MVISRDQVLEILTDVCPSFLLISEREVADAANSLWYDGDKLSIYIAMAAFASHLVEQYKINQVAEFKEIFLAIERLHLDGDDFVKEAVTIGLLEGIQNISANAGIDPKVFEPYLAPESKEWWGKLNDFWNGKSPTAK